VPILQGEKVDAHDLELKIAETFTVKYVHTAQGR
jgi:hypothetical protein